MNKKEPTINGNDRAFEIFMNVVEANEKLRASTREGMTNLLKQRKVSKESVLAIFERSKDIETRG
jgi:hypothetical protein